MLVNFRPTITNQFQLKNNHQGVAFKQGVAPNQEWLTKILKEPSFADNEYVAHFLNPNNKISKEEFIATLEAAKGKLRAGFRDCIQDTIEWAKNFQRG